MSDVFTEAKVYLHDISGPSCKDSKDTMIRKLMEFQEGIAAADTDHNHTALINALLTKIENIMSDCDNDTVPADVAEAVPEKQREIVYNQDNAEQASWAVETVTNVSFDDVVGAEEAIGVIREAIILPTKFPRIFEKARANPWRGALLYGPPGTGKSLLARAAACEANIPFFNTSCADLTSKWVGGSEKLVRGLFESARQNAPSIIFLDEIDSVASSRDQETSMADQRLTNQLLLEIDCNANQKTSVFVMGATNVPWNLDPAVMRRLPKKLYIKIPLQADRLKILTKSIPSDLDLSSTDFENLAAASEGFSGSDLVNFANDLLMTPLRNLLMSTSFFVHRNELTGEVASVTPVTSSWADAVHNTSFERMAEEYGEDAIVLPKLTSSAAFETLKSYRRNVKTPDTNAYDRFFGS